MGDLTITNIRCRRLGWSESPTTLQASLVSPTTKYSTHGHDSRTWWGPSPLVVVEIEVDDGIIGIGSCGGFTALPAAVIEDHFAPLVIGMSAYDRELIWDKLYRSSVRFGRVGVTMAAIAGIDIALHDIVGKALGVPVYQLLGGAIRDHIPVYVSRLYAHSNIDVLQAEAAQWLSEGFTMMKQRFGYGPADGIPGMKKNEELIRAVREVVGDDVMLAADAYMGWDVPYAVEMSRRLEKYNLSWIEEPLLGGDIDGYEELCRRSEVAISHGEHLYNKSEFMEVIKRRAAAYLQPDLNRVGGFTEARKIAALAETAGIPLIPHSNEMHNIHLAASSVAIPMMEYFPDELPDTGNELFWRVFDGEIVAKDGFINIPRKPGLGVSLNMSVINEIELRG